MEEPAGVDGCRGRRCLLRPCGYVRPIPPPANNARKPAPWSCQIGMQQAGARITREGVPACTAAEEEYLGHALIRQPPVPTCAPTAPFNPESPCLLIQFHSRVGLGRLGAAAGLRHAGALIQYPRMPHAARFCAACISDCASLKWPDVFLRSRPHPAAASQKLF